MDENNAEITQIAIDPNPGFRGELYGVASDGKVYLYDRDYLEWRPLSMKIRTTTTNKS